MRNHSATWSRVVVSLVILIALLPFAEVSSAKETQIEEYIREAMPPSMQVINIDNEGNVFADAKGRTLYAWPITPLRNGDAGDQRDKSACGDTRYRVNAGLMSPYPGGLELPDADHRPSCVEVWPPLFAADAQTIGKWTILTRPDGKKQWAYDGQALYTSVLDKKPGDAIGGSRLFPGGDAQGALREPVGPSPEIPPQFVIHTTQLGRLVATSDQKSIYYSDEDKAKKSNCVTDACLAEWIPVTAPEFVKPRGGWSTFERSPGIRQWAFRDHPLYTHARDVKFPSQEGSDVPGWHNVYTQIAAPFPPGFVIQQTASGLVLADAQRKTIYIFHCNDDALDQLSCNHPTTPQDYRLAICGKGDWERCLKNFPYVPASVDARSDSRIWSILSIDPRTGRTTESGAPGAMRVWAYRDRPVYLCGRDRNPGDFECDSWGEMSGRRNGYKAFWLRDVFGRNAP